MNRRGRILLTIVLLLLLGLVALLAAGPYLTLRGIGQLMEQGKITELERYVDFPVLKGNLKDRLEDRIARELAARNGGGLMTEVAKQITGPAVEAMVSPAGIAMLLQGHALMRRVQGESQDNGTLTPSGSAKTILAQAKTGFDSPSRFHAEVQSASGQPVRFVLARQGLRWRVVDIRFDDADAAAQPAAPTQSALPAAAH